MVNKIHSYPQNPRVFKALIAAQYNKVPVDVLAGFQFGVTNKTTEFLTNFPFGKVPAMETADGPLYESNAIASYIAYSTPESQLVGKNAYEIALIQQYVNVADNEVCPAAATWLYPLMGYVLYNEQNSKKAQEDIKKALAVLNQILATRTYFVGERITLADICMLCAVYHLYTMVLSPELRAPYVNVNRWLDTMVNQPEVKAVLGETKLCEVTQTYDPSKFAKECCPAVKAAAAKDQKASACPPKAAKKADDEEEEESFEDKPKGKNPMDLLPPSTFVLDEWKRFYSNNETRPDAVDFFWKNFDAEGYSMWNLTYKYNDELTKVFMSSNLIGGFFQRLENLRKYGFGSLGVYGEDNASIIAGMFIIRGQEIPEIVKECPDFESYEFVKVDPKDAAVRKAWEETIAWDGEVQGKKFADGKVFK